MLDILKIDLHLQRIIQLIELDQIPQRADLGPSIEIQQLKQQLETTHINLDIHSLANSCENRKALHLKLAFLAIAIVLQFCAIETNQIQIQPHDLVYFNQEFMYSSVQDLWVHFREIENWVIEPEVFQTCPDLGTEINQILLEDLDPVVNRLFVLRNSQTELFPECLWLEQVDIEASWTRDLSVVKTFIFLVKSTDVQIKMNLLFYRNELSASCSVSLIWINDFNTR